MEKIIVIVREFQSLTGIDVDSRLFDGESLNPLIFIRDDGTRFHLGQVSSSIHWAVQDIPDPTRTTKQELDRRYPDGYEFVYYYIPLKFLKIKSRDWWGTLSHSQKMEMRDEIDDSEIKSPNLYESLWIKFQMIHEAINNLKPIDPNNIIIEPYFPNPPRVRKFWKVEIQFNFGGVSREFDKEPSEYDVQEMVDIISQEPHNHIRDISVSLKFKLI